MLKLFKKSAVEIAGYNPYSELVFGGWDYNIANKQSAILKSKSILKVHGFLFFFCVVDFIFVYFFVEIYFCTSIANTIQHFFNLLSISLVRTFFLHYSCRV